MLVIITEDDPQGGVDHIDAHRSLLLMAGPFVKRNSVSSMHANFGSIIHTMYHILGIAPVNQFDFTSTLLSEFFTDSPNFKPYQLEASDLRIFNPDVVMKRYNRAVSWREVKMSESMDNELEIKKLSK